jgi:hypothetical protein
MTMEPKRTSPLPDFLVIGAMKSGTTTLYADLDAQPSICMSAVKEPSVLVHGANPGDMRARYAELFPTSPAGRLLGEASTYYSQIPRHTGVAERARALLGDQLRVLYLVRNPVERAVSHHHHAYVRGLCGPDVDHVARTNPTLVDFGRYAMQLEPWMEAFGRDRIMVVRFEDYVRDRGGVIQAIGRWMGVATDASSLRMEQKLNAGDDAHAPGWFAPLLRSQLYQVRLRGMVPPTVRARLRRWLMPRRRARVAPGIATIDFLIDSLRDDSDRLARLLDWRAPIWDFDATRRKFAS